MVAADTSPLRMAAVERESDKELDPEQGDSSKTVNKAPYDPSSDLDAVRGGGFASHTSVPNPQPRALAGAIVAPLLGRRRWQQGHGWRSSNRSLPPSPSGSQGPANYSMWAIGHVDAQRQAPYPSEVPGSVSRSSSLFSTSLSSDDGAEPGRRAADWFRAGGSALAFSGFQTAPLLAALNSMQDSSILGDRTAPAFRVGGQRLHWQGVSQARSSYPSSQHGAGHLRSELSFQLPPHAYGGATSREARQRSVDCWT